MSVTKASQSPTSAAGSPTSETEVHDQRPIAVDPALERVLAQVDTQAVPAAGAAVGKANASALHQGLSAAWIEKWEGGDDVHVRLCPSGEVVQAELMRELDRSLIEDATRERQLVLIDRHADRLLVIGVIATRKPKKLKLDADSIELLATRSLLLRVGRAALELRQDGNIEIVGSRISAASRGLFRLVGRMLRLN